MKDILIIGDSCRDIFVYCDSNRLAPDYPVPVLNVKNQIENSGMAKNVQRNINQHMECDIITNSNWYDVTKTRYVHDKTNHMFCRVDSNTIIPNIERIDEIDLDYKLVIVSDYDKGFLSRYDIETICKNHTNVFLDTKKILGRWAEDAAYIKINDFEYTNSKKSITTALESKIIHTVGGDGCIFNHKMYSVNRVDIKDTSGAGDSFMAALCVEYIKSENIEKSIIFANKCASEVVKYRGVTTI